MHDSLTDTFKIVAGAEVFKMSISEAKAFTNLAASLGKLGQDPKSGPMPAVVASSEAFTDLAAAMSARKEIEMENLAEPLEEQHNAILNIKKALEAREDARLHALGLKSTVDGLTTAVISIKALLLRSLNYCCLGRSGCRQCCQTGSQAASSRQGNCG